jgi:hypothetical protein
MSFEYRIGHLIETEREYNASEILIGTLWIDDSSTIVEIVKSKNEGFVYYKFVYRMNGIFDSHIADFQKRFSRIVVTNIHEHLTSENITSIICDKECPKEVLTDIQNNFDGEFALEYINTFRENDPSEYEKFQTYFLEQLETTQSIVMIVLNSLEKEYAYEKFLETFNKL